MFTTVSQSVCSRDIYVIKLSFSLRRTLGYQEVSARIGLQFSPLKIKVVAVSISFAVYGEDAVIGTKSESCRTQAPQPRPEVRPEVTFCLYA